MLTSTRNSLASWSRSWSAGSRVQAVPWSSICPPLPLRATLIQPLTTPRHRDASGVREIPIAVAGPLWSVVCFGVDRPAWSPFNGSAPVSVGSDFSGLLEPLTDCTRLGVSSFYRRFRVAVVVSDPMGSVHRHRSSVVRFCLALLSLGRWSVVSKSSVFRSRCLHGCSGVWSVSPVP